MRDSCILIYEHTLDHSCRIRMARKLISFWKPENISWALNVVQIIIDFFLDLIVGYSLKFGWRKEREKARHDYHHSAQLVSSLPIVQSICGWQVNVHYYGPLAPAVKDEMCNYVLSHSEYVSPEYALRKDVYIMGLDDTNVWFSVIPEEVHTFLNYSKLWQLSSGRVV